MVIRVENIISAIQNTVSISLFNKGLTRRIFGDVKKNGSKVVMKNNMAECVLLSPDEYVELINELNDAKLLSEANSRLAHLQLDQYISQEELLKKHGISQKEIDTMDEVDLE